jgi:acyl dehydratase
MGTPMYFEDWQVGHVYETAEREVSLELARRFGEIEGSQSPLHLDEDYARNESVFGALTAHGLLTISMAAGMMGEMGMFEDTALAFLGMTWQFHAPIVIGDRIRVRWWVGEKRETRKGDRGIVTREMEVLVGDTVTCTGTMTTLWKKRPVVAAV